MSTPKSRSFATIADLDRAGAPRRSVMPQILDAAERVFATHGLAGTRLEEIARLCVIPKANILYYFGTKDDLYRATLLRVLELWLADADDWFVPSKEPRTAVEGYVRAKMAFSRARPEASSLFSQELLSGGRMIRGFLEGELRTHVARRAELFRSWQREGAMAAIDPTHFLFMLWSMTQAYADMRVQFQAVLAEESLSERDYETGVETIMTLLSAVFPSRPERPSGVRKGPSPRGSR